MDPWNRLGYFGNLSDTVIGISIDGRHLKNLFLVLNVITQKVESSV